MCDILYKLDKSAEDVEELLRRHKNLVYSMLTSYGQLNNQDAESAAWEGLWDAINTFDVFATTAFSTYACTVIKRRIGDVLRKQNAEYKNSLKYMTEMQPDAVALEPGYLALENDDEQFIQRFRQLFATYLTYKSGTTRSILLAWYSTEFRGGPNDIAALCGATASFVCRVQCDFRAYLSSKIKS